LRDDHPRQTLADFRHRFHRICRTFRPGFRSSAGTA
jgi:hypothetical protein